MQIPPLKSIPLVVLASAAAWGLVGCEKKQTEGSAVRSSQRSATAEKNPSTVGRSEVAPAVPVPREGNPPVVPAPEPPGPTASNMDFSGEADRILNLPEGAERDAVLGQFVRSSMRDGGFERTEEWIGKMPAGAARDTAQAAFIEDLANVAPMLALDHTNRILNPSLRASLEAKIRSSPAFTQSPLNKRGAQGAPGANAPAPAEVPVETDP